MRFIVVSTAGLALLLAGSLPACGSSQSTGFGDDGTGGPGGGKDSGGGNTGDDSGNFNPGDDGGNLVGDGGKGHPDAGGTVSTTVYAHTDDTLYSMDPKSKAITLIGKFAGQSGSTGDSTVTDLAVNANGDVYVNTESVVYRAALGSTVQLTKVASIAVKTGQKFFALAFAPKGALDPNAEVLVGGDGAGDLYSIDTTNGTTKNLGNFGNDPSHPGSHFGLSGDVMFYLDPNNNATGLATIRSCSSGSTCIKSNDFLAGVDMKALASAYTSGTPASSLNAGIYGGSQQSVGPGTGFGELFGLGAWGGTIFAYARHTTASPPQLVTIDTGSGQGTMVTNNFSFTNGWSGAGVTTTVSVVVPPPPPPPQ